jgi:superfamily II DNA or RNA helicase
MKTTSLREQKTKKRRLDERKKVTQITKTQKELKKLFDLVLNSRKKLEVRDYQNEFLTDPKYLYSPKVVLAGGTSSGKTEMTIMKLEMFYQDLKNQKEKTIIIPASKNILKDNFTNRLEKFSPSFSYVTIDNKMSKEEIKRLLSSEGPQVIVCLPQLLKNNIEYLGEVHNFILDEAQEWYFVGRDREFSGTIFQIIEKCRPKHQLLLTGTPFLFNGKDEFEIFYVPAMELYEGGHISDVTVEMVTSSLKFKNSDYTGPFGDLKTSVKFKRKSDEDSLDQVCKEMIKKLKNPLKKNHTLNKITDNCLSVFNYLNKTIIFCDSIDQANHFYEKLQSFPGLKGKVCISHSGNDPDSNQFVLFEISEEMKVMVAVDRGKIGYNLPELYNIVDFTYSQNLTLLLQMLGRLFRKVQGRKKQDKIYYKVAPKGNASYFEDIMSAVWCLTHREWYEKFDLKNMGEIRIPRIKKEKKNRSQGSGERKIGQKKEKKIILTNG